MADKVQGIVEWLLVKLFESFIQPFADLRTLKQLIFGVTDEYRSVWGTFRPTDLTDALGPSYTLMMILAGFFLVAFIVMYGIRIAGAPLNPHKRIETIELVKDLVIVGLLLGNLPVVYDVLFQINSGIVGLFSSVYDGETSARFEEFSTKKLEPDDADGLMGKIFVQLVMIGLMLWANFYYFMRKVTLIILMALGPLMVVFWLHPQFKSLTGSWFKEFASSIFVQSIHAFVFWMVLTISTTETGFIETVIVYVIFIPISESLRRLLNFGGDMQGGLTKAGAMMGMAGLAGMYGAAKGAMNGKGVMGTLKGAYDGVKDGKTGEQSSGGDNLKGTHGAEAGGDLGTNPRAEQMLRAGDIVGRMGKATIGMAGAVSGMALGPVGTMAGASLGFGAGGVVGGLTGRMGAAGVHGLADRMKKGKEEFDSFKNGSASEFDDELANNIADRDTASWADANKDKEMSGLRNRFPDATDDELDSKFNQMKEGKRNQFRNQAKQQLVEARNNEGKVHAADLIQNSANGMADQWEADNKERVLSEYDKAHPQQKGESAEAFSARREKAFSNEKEKARQGFEDTGRQYATAQAMTDQWAKDNKKDFNKSYGESNPIQNGESTDDFAERRQQAYNKKKKQMFDGFMESGALHANAEGMTKQWEADNKDTFMGAYEAANPRKEGESAEGYQKRRQEAYSAKKQEAFNGFMESGRQYANAEAMTKQWEKDHKKSFMASYDSALPQEEHETDRDVSTRRNAAFKKKRNTVRDGYLSDSDSLATPQAMTARWEAENKDRVLAEYDASHPQQAHETPEQHSARRQQMFNTKKASVQKGFESAGKSYVSADAMTKQWEASNRDAFLSNYEQANPRGVDETPAAYNDRKQNAYQQKVQSVSRGFNAHEQKYNAQSIGSRAISIQGFNQHLQNAGGAFAQFVGSENAGRLVSAGQQSIAQLNAPTFASNGTPNTTQLARKMAHAKADRIENEYANQQETRGVDRQEAIQDFRKNHRPQVVASSVPEYQEQITQASDRSYGRMINPGSIPHKFGVLAGQSGAFVMGATGITGAIRGANTLLTDSAIVASTAKVASQTMGAGYVSSLVSATKAGAGAGYRRMFDMDNDGPVEAQQNYQNKAAYVAGVLAGPKGYRGTRNLASKISPIRQQVQDDIHSAGEVLQMARTTTDDYGNVVIPQGAMRQVITAEESYIEVMTKSGERKVVSRKGAGHSGMRKNDVVYQDLVEDNGMIVAKSPNTYRIDSAGGRSTSSVQVMTEPSNLLGSPRVGTKHQQQVSQQIPVYSQSVDNGKFYTNDLAQQGFTNAQVVIDKNQQYVSAVKDGQTYRVSQVFSGDSRLGSEDRVQIPVRVQHDRIVPNYEAAPSVAVKSQLVMDRTIVDDNHLYYSSQNPETLIQGLESIMPSKHTERANRSVDRRRNLDSMRRRQGFLG